MQETPGGIEAWHTVTLQQFNNLMTTTAFVQLGRMLSFGTISFEDRFCTSGKKKVDGCQLLHGWQHMAAMAAACGKALVSTSGPSFSFPPHQNHSSHHVRARSLALQTVFVQRSVPW